jgi:hypothetical protein
MEGLRFFYVIGTRVHRRARDTNGARAARRFTR